MSAEGWCWPGLSRRSHYFRRGRSLCGRYEQEAGAALVPEANAHCAECSRRKRREAAPAGGAR